MPRIVSLYATFMLFLAFQPVNAEESVSNSQNTKTTAANDLRQLVSMPAETRQLMREDMLAHLSALNEIIGYLATGNLNTAADVAESRMGKSSMGKHRATGMGPGRFMPLEMRKIGWGMHDAATEFSLIAKKGDLKAAYSALQKVTTSCVVCHYSYRTQ